MGQVDETVGARIAAYRKRKGITQPALAGLVGRSESWLSQVERGVRTVDRLSAFGPTNVMLHKVSAATRMGDPLRVLSDAATVNTDALPVALNGRRASLHLDLAAAQAQRRHDPEAVLHLVEAERIAPELLRYYVTAHVVVRDLLRRERRTQTPALRPLAARAGML